MDLGALAGQHQELLDLPGDLGADLDADHRVDNARRFDGVSVLLATAATSATSATSRCLCGLVGRCAPQVVRTRRDESG